MAQRVRQRAAMVRLRLHPQVAGVARHTQQQRRQERVANLKYLIKIIRIFFASKNTYTI